MSNHGHGHMKHMTM